MPVTYEKLWNYPIGMVPEVGPQLAKKLLASAWEEILDSKETWSFLTKETFLTVRDAVTVGTVAVTQDSATVTPDATASAALDAAHAIASIVGMQFVAGQGPFYTVSAYTLGGNITLDRVYFEETNGSAAYHVTEAYKDAPADWRRWISIVDKVEDFQLDIYSTRQELDERDPQRSITDSPRAVVSLDYNPTTNLPRFEFYPFPQVRRQYPTLYQRVPFELSNSVVPPAIIPQRLLEHATLLQAYQWAESNRTRFEQLAGADWRFLYDRVQKEYMALLQKVKRNDDSIYHQNWATNYLNPPLYGRGARYLQSHAPYPAG